MTRVAGPLDADTERLSEAFDRFIDALRRARGRVPAGSDHHLTLAQAERAILDTLEHHAHLRLRPVGAR